MCFSILTGGQDQGLTPQFRIFMHGRPDPIIRIRKGTSGHSETVFLKFSDYTVVDDILK